MEDICKDCNCNCRNEHDCDSCEYNIGQDPAKSSGYIAGPCGQQNCWFSTTVCLYNNGSNYEPI
jgi:hypothetical protein